MSIEVATDHRVEDVRNIAIDHHHDVVSVFEEHYRTMERDRFANAFAYGRFKVDVLLDKTLDRLPKGAAILDVGCGTGVYLRRFRDRGLVASGLEPAPAMLAAARRANPDLRIEQGVSVKLPFADASFDAITAIEVLRYLHPADVAQSVTEMLRVLRPNGSFFITLVNRFALDGFYLLQRLRQARKGVEFDRRNPHCEFTTPVEVERLLTRLGAVNVQTEGRLFAPIRIAYKANGAIGSRVASLLERIDDRVHESMAWTKPFAGHLIAIGERGR
jgi:SAM-dependent methyltransferase